MNSCWETKQLTFISLEELSNPSLGLLDSSETQLEPFSQLEEKIDSDLPTVLQEHINDSPGTSFKASQTTL